MKKLIILTAMMLIASYTYSQDIIGKSTVGMQLWHQMSGDGSPMAAAGDPYHHWSIDNNLTPAPGNCHFDLYPNVQEYTETYPTGLANLGSGAPAKLHSSYNASTINMYVKWIKDYNVVDNIALQRFGVSYSNTNKMAAKNTEASRLKDACVANSKKFYIMYDISDWTNFKTEIKTDWTNTIVGSLALTASSAYAKEKVGTVSKPVVCIWGMGSTDRPGTNADYTDVINWFKNTAGCYVILGLDKDWRIQTADPENFISSWNLAHMISPWSVGAFSDTSGANNYASKMALDKAYCDARSIAYMPVVWPRFSWTNWKPGYELTPNHKPGIHGDFMWKQMFNVKDKGISSVYVAMFDEVDEGTAILKAAENSSDIPTNQWFLTLDADGVPCSSDFYLRLTSNGTKMVKGTLAKTWTHDASTAHTILSNITTNAVTAITSTTATGNANLTLGAGVTAKGLCWATTANPTTANSKTTITTNAKNHGTFTGSLTGLTASTTYYVRAYATNPSGTAYGNQVSFTTAAGGTTYFAVCDALSENGTWQTGTGNTISVTSSDIKQGANALKCIGSLSNEFKRVNSPVFNSGLTEATAALKFWYYCSDVTKSSARHIELGSGGVNDVNEYDWNLTTTLAPLVNGWNYIDVKVTSATKVGTPNLASLNWFRFYATKTASLTTKIDAIQVLAATASSKSAPMVDKQSNGFTMYPNPLVNDAKLTINIKGQGATEIKILNLNGQLVYSQKLDNVNTVNINTKDILKSGLYFVSLISNEGSINQKLLVK